MKTSPLFSLLLLLLSTVPAAPAQERLPFRDPALPLERRVQDLVGRMTVQEKIDQMQYEAPAIPRLGIPAYNWWNECLHGVARAGRATVFPQAIGLAATWDALQARGWSEPQLERLQQAWDSAD